MIRHGPGNNFSLIDIIIWFNYQFDFDSYSSYIILSLILINNKNDIDDIDMRRDFSFFLLFI